MASPPSLHVYGFMGFIWVMMSLIHNYFVVVPLRCYAASFLFFYNFVGDAMLILKDHFFLALNFVTFQMFMLTQLHYTQTKVKKLKLF